MIGVLEDKDAAGVLSALRPVVDRVVCFQNRSPRALPAHELAELAHQIYPGAVSTAADAESALSAARKLVEVPAEGRTATKAGFIVGNGSVVTASELRVAVGRTTGAQ